MCYSIKSYSFSVTRSYGELNKVFIKNMSLEIVEISAKTQVPLFLLKLPHCSKVILDDGANSFSCLTMFLQF